MSILHLTSFTCLFACFTLESNRKLQLLPNGGAHEMHLPRTKQWQWIYVSAGVEWHFLSPKTMKAILAEWLWGFLLPEGYDSLFLYACACLPTIVPLAWNVCYTTALLLLGMQSTNKNSVRDFGHMCNLLVVAKSKTYLIQADICLQCKNSNRYSNIQYCPIDRCHH
jgi:hypothetical protein